MSVVPNQLGTLVARRAAPGGFRERERSQLNGRPKLSFSESETVPVWPTGVLTRMTTPACGPQVAEHFAARAPRKCAAERRPPRRATSRRETLEHILEPAARRVTSAPRRGPGLCAEAEEAATWRRSPQPL
eukprot:363248-Chlamydomonas_euryale.AAC.2